ncbi:MAG: PaaI family thioesterase [Syntrophomonadaceae bacterium]|jgi:acyl-CoA thioesterase|nr:PaaI family thioesterase [Syntrophomonadaceae bacterium]
MICSETENRGINDDLFNSLCQIWNGSPVLQTLGVKLTYLGPGEMGLKLCPGLEYTTVKERVHGGLSATLLDTAMGWAIMSLGHSCVTVDMYTNYYIPTFRDNEIIAEAQVTHMGKRTVVAEANLYNNKRQLLAQSRGTFALVADDR